jgi:UPF0755 protein
VAQRERESLAETPVGDADPHSLLFGADDDYRDRTGEFEAPKLTRAERRQDQRQLNHHRRRQRRGWYFVVIALILAALVAVGGYVVVKKFNWFGSAADYSGSGTGSVTVTVPSGATAQDIGNILKNKDVVKSVEAFTDAAKNNPKSTSIQAGTYILHAHMSGVAALNLLLDPSSRDTATTAVVTEGMTSMDVATKINSICGESQADATTKALSSPADLGVPVSYKVNSKLPSSVEGFLYPATYRLQPNCKPASALQTMVSTFISRDRSLGFAETAQHIGLSPYEALIIASIAQSEAKFPQDMPKVARTILNRIHANTHLQFDSTSSYACKLRNETHCIYAQVNSPYNTYTHKGLPPTPIDNPGAPALRAAVHPAHGNWLYFVNRDKAGHLIFTHTASAFEKARQRCARNNWGCG